MNIKKSKTILFTSLIAVALSTTIINQTNSKYISQYRVGNSFNLSIHPTMYKIHFDTKGGTYNSSTIMDPLAVCYNEDIGDGLMAPSKSQNMFAGWFKDNNLNEAIYRETTYKYSSDINVTAHYGLMINYIINDVSIERGKFTHWEGNIQTGLKYGSRDTHVGYVDQEYYYFRPTDTGDFASDKNKDDPYLIYDVSVHLEFPKPIDAKTYKHIVIGYQVIGGVNNYGKKTGQGMSIFPITTANSNADAQGDVSDWQQIILSDKPKAAIFHFDNITTKYYNNNKTTGYDGTINKLRLDYFDSKGGISTESDEKAGNFGKYTDAEFRLFYIGFFKTNEDAVAACHTIEDHEYSIKKTSSYK